MPVLELLAAGKGVANAAVVKRLLDHVEDVAGADQNCDLFTRSASLDVGRDTGDDLFCFGEGIVELEVFELCSLILVSEEVLPQALVVESDELVRCIENALG